jgi:adenine/guanine phosphoribosyltransferase-like PRPP-binding protein
MVAEESEVGFVFAERFAPPPSDVMYPVRYRIPDALRDGLKGLTVAIVNDVTNAGSAVRGTYDDLLACGARPVALGTLTALGAWASNFAAASNLALESLEVLPNNLWTPDDCPLCTRSVALEDPST